MLHYRAETWQCTSYRDSNIQINDKIRVVQTIMITLTAVAHSTLAPSVLNFQHLSELKPEAKQAFQSGEVWVRSWKGRRLKAEICALWQVE